MYDRLTTVGLEIEVENIVFTTDLLTRISRYGFKYVGDASVQGSIQTLDGIKVFHEFENIYFLPKERVGGELISQPPIDTKVKGWQENIKRLCNLLQEEEFIKPSYRCSFHVHVNVDRFEYETLMSMIQWAALLEAIMFRIGSLGGTHRGVFNNFNYCRPITYRGPQVVKIPDGYSQVMLLEDLLQAQDLNDFFLRYGDSLHNTDMKYHPVRYSWINLFKLIQKERTIEFRIFNQTLDPMDIEAIITLCLCIVNTMLTSPPQDVMSYSSNPVNSIFYPLEESRNILRMVLGMYPANPIVKDRIMWLFDHSEYPKIENKNVFSHMMTKRDFKLFTREIYHPPFVDTNTVENCKYQDEHNFEYPSGFSSYLIKIRK